MAIYNNKKGHLLRSTCYYTDFSSFADSVRLAQEHSYFAPSKLIFPSMLATSSCWLLLHLLHDTVSGCRPTSDGLERVSIELFLQLNHAPYIRVQRMILRYTYSKVAGSTTNIEGIHNIKRYTAPFRLPLLFANCPRAYSDAIGAL